jgi:hypothetical protein
MENAKYFKLKEYKEYLEFIHSCKTKTYDDNFVLHTHHIIPKHLWADTEKSVNNKDNLIELSVEDHVRAHLLLSMCYDVDTYECISNLRSARILSNKSITDKTTLDKIAETYYGSNNPFYGKTHTEETKKLLAEFTRKSKSGKTYEELYGERANEERKKRSKKTRTDAQYMEAAKKASKKLKGLMVGEKNPAAQSYMVEGMVFGCKTDMLTHFNTSMYFLKKEKDIIRITKDDYNKLKNK